MASTHHHQSGSKRDKKSVTPFGGCVFRYWLSSYPLTILCVSLFCLLIGITMYATSEPPFGSDWHLSSCSTQRAQFFKPCRSDFECRICQLEVIVQYNHEPAPSSSSSSLPPLKPALLPTNNDGVVQSQQYTTMKNVEYVSKTDCLETLGKPGQMFLCYYQYTPFPNDYQVNIEPKLSYDRTMDLYQEEVAYNLKWIFFSCGGIAAYVLIVLFKILLPWLKVKFPIFRWCSFRYIFNSCVVSCRRRARAQNGGGNDSDVSDLSALATTDSTSPSSRQGGPSRGGRKHKRRTIEEEEDDEIRSYQPPTFLLRNCSSEATEAIHANYQEYEDANQ